MVSARSFFSRMNQYRNENNKASFDESNVHSLFVYAVRSQII